jgi:hypothetical protein
VNCGLLLRLQGIAFRRASVNFGDGGFAGVPGSRVDERDESPHHHVRSGRIEVSVGHQVEVDEESGTLMMLGVLLFNLLVFIVVWNGLAEAVRAKIQTVQVGFEDDRVIVNQPDHLGGLSPALRSCSAKELGAFGDQVAVDCKPHAVWFDAHKHAESLGEVVSIDIVSRVFSAKNRDLTYPRCSPGGSLTGSLSLPADSSPSLLRLALDIEGTVDDLSRRGIAVST